MAGNEKSMSYLLFPSFLPSLSLFLNLSLNLPLLLPSLARLLKPQIPSFQRIPKSAWTHFMHLPSMTHLIFQNKKILDQTSYMHLANVISL